MTIPIDRHRFPSYAAVSRRELLCRAFNGIGGLALASLLAGEGQGGGPANDSANPLAPKKPHFPPAAKRCIFLFMSGGVSQVDTFEHKPALTKYAGKTMPALPNLKGEIAANLTKNAIPMPEMYPFASFGEAGRTMSSLFEQLGPHIDSLAFVHGIIGDSNNHGPATLQLNTGSELQGSPSVGSWVSYGLGSESQDLPGYVVICDPRGEPTNGNACWSAGFLPASYQGTPLNSKGPPIVDLNFPAGMTQSRARRELDLIRRLNERHAAMRPEHQELESRIAAYELAYRMQMAAPEAIDISHEPEPIQRLYGLDQSETQGFGRQCLLARRLAERGVRFTLLVHGVTNSGEMGWDHHGAIRPNIKKAIGEIDRPIAGLLTDLKQRGMLDDTLVVFTSEMGRTPFRQLGTPADLDKAGRDHNQYGLCSWLAGAGVKPASDAGATDEFGVRGVGEEILMRDLHATILHLLGLDDNALTYLHEGRFKRLTDLGGRVLDDILAEMLTWTTFHLIAEWIIRLVMLVYVPQRRSPAAARSWLLLIFIFPYLGLLLYSIFGRAYLPRWRIEIQERASHMLRTVGRDVFRQYAAHPDLPSPYLQAVTLAESLGDFGILGGNQIELLVDYDRSVDRLVAEIDAATQHVHLLYYIFGDDRTGRRVADALKQAVARGVKCRVLMDGLGSKKALRNLAPRMRAEGIEVYEALPVRLWRRKSARFDLRNHRKIAVMDGKVAYVGSQNLINCDFKPGLIYEELVARVTGPVALQLQAVFLTDYYLESNTNRLGPEFFPQEQLAGAVAAQALPSGPGFPQANAQRLILSLLHAAQQRVVITSPYFIPDEPLLDAMKIAVLRGVEVHLVVSRQADQFLVCQAQHSYYDELLESGVRIHLYREHLLHAKHLSFDDQIAIIGSSNLDMRSFLLNAEISLIVHDPQVASALGRVQERYFEESDLLTLEEWRRRPGWRKVVENTARLVDSVL